MCILKPLIELVQMLMSHLNTYKLKYNFSQGSQQYVISTKQFSTNLLEFVNHYTF